MSLKYSRIVEAIKANDLNEVKNMVENGHPFDKSSIYIVVVIGLQDILQF